MGTQRLAVIWCGRAGWAVVIAAMIAGCAGVKPALPQGVADTAANHYRTGMKLIDAGEYGRALEEFERSQALAPDLAPAYEGLGLAYLGRGDLKAAEEQMAQAKRKDDAYVPAYVGMGRVLAAKGDLRGAREELEGALSRDPRSVPAHFHLGQVYLKGLEFTKAESSFARALDLDPTFAPARQEWERSVKIRIAAPGTAVGKRIALADPVTRADLAALLATEFGLEEKLRARRPEVFDPTYQPPPGLGPAPAAAVRASDIDSHWARNAIELVTRLNLLEVFPDSTFRPDAPASRATLAMILGELLVVARGDDGLRSRFVGSASPFSDVRSDHYAFNAIVLATTSGLIEPDRKTGAFRPADSVSGPDALLSMRKLAELF